VQCLENHDVVCLGHDAARAPTLTGGSGSESWCVRSRSRAATAVLFAAPGIPAIFLRQEIPEDKLWSDDEKDYTGHLIW
jgi:1,4-alpha-glucan branching enzyme